MVIKIGAISYPSAVSSYSYTAYSDPFFNSFIGVTEVTSSSTALSPSYVLTSSSPAINAVAKARTALIGSSYTDYKKAQNLFISIGSQVLASSQINSVTLLLGLGDIVPVDTVQSLASALFGSVYTRFNPVFIPNIIDIQISNRGQGELDEKQKVGTEILGGQEFNNSLNVYESTNGIIDNLSPIQSKILTKNILDKSKPKDRRNIIKSLVNHYSDAGKRI
jgi:hypothetical protein